METNKVLEVLNSKGYTVEAKTNPLGLSQLIINDRWSLLFGKYSQLHALLSSEKDFDCIEVFDILIPDKDVAIFRKGDKVDDLIAWMMSEIE